MRTECYNHRYVNDLPIPVSRLVAKIGTSKCSLIKLNINENLKLENSNNHYTKKLFLESQIPTQRYGRRPFGVGLLIAGYDVIQEFITLAIEIFDNLSKIFQICFLYSLQIQNFYMLKNFFK